MNTTVSAFLRRSCGGSLSYFAKSTCVVPTRAGQRWRLMQGIGRSGNEDGPLHDMNDWEYAGKAISKIFSYCVVIYLMKTS